MKKNLLSLCLILLLASCRNSSKDITFKSDILAPNTATSISIQTLKSKGNNDSSARINQTIIDSTIATINEDLIGDDLNGVATNFETEFLRFKEDFPDSDDQWELNVETEELYNSSEVITISINTYSYAGGAHGNDEILLLNFNPKTGSILKIYDIVGNLEEFKKLAQTYFIKNLDSTEGDFKMEDFFFGSPFKLPQNIGFSDEGLVLLYNVYEIASYAQGYTEFKIPYNDIEGLRFL